MTRLRLTRRGVLVVKIAELALITMLILGFVVVMGVVGGME